MGNGPSNSVETTVSADAIFISAADFFPPSDDRGIKASDSLGVSSTDSTFALNEGDLEREREIGREILTLVIPLQFDSKYLDFIFDNLVDSGFSTDGRLLQIVKIHRACIRKMTQTTDGPSDFSSLVVAGTRKPNPAFCYLALRTIQERLGESTSLQAIKDFITEIFKIPNLSPLPKHASTTPPPIPAAALEPGDELVAQLNQMARTTTNETSAPDDQPDLSGFEIDPAGTKKENTSPNPELKRFVQNVDASQRSRGDFDDIVL
jgi:hypothetical protein